MHDSEKYDLARRNCIVTFPEIFFQSTLGH
jgi:hypothetical protein